MLMNLFRIVCIAGGAFILLTGLDNALGGLTTMGWLASTDFLTVTDQARSEIRDNHIRFIGAIWAGIGLFWWLAATNPLKYRQGLYLTFALIFLAGFARFTAGDFELVFGPDIIGSLAAELLGMPALAFWLKKISDPS